MDTSMPWILSNLECEMEKEKGIMSPCFHHTEFGWQGDVTMRTESIVSWFNGKFISVQNEITHRMEKMKTRATKLDRFSNGPEKIRRVRDERVLFRYTN